jgi:hypothetical protein
MKQAKFTINETQAAFVNRYDKLGFKDKSAVVRQALDCLMESLEEERMRRGVELYADLYEQDEELRTLSRASMEDWNANGTRSGDDHKG